MSSRLGDPEPKPKTGAARYAAPATVETGKSESVKKEKLKKVKQQVTIRLTFEAVDRLAEIERDLRRAGIRPSQANGSEIIEALILNADVTRLLDVIR